MSRDLHLAQLVADGRVSLDGLIARRVALEAEQERAQLLQLRLDARNARRRARRAAGKGTRPAGDSAPAPVVVPAPSAEELQAAAEAILQSSEPDAAGLVWCRTCRLRVTPAVLALHRGDQRAATVDAFAARRAQLGLGVAGEFNPMTAQW